MVWTLPEDTLSFPCEAVGKRPSAALPSSPALFLATRDGEADLTGQVIAAYFYLMIEIKTTFLVEKPINHVFRRISDVANY